MSGYFVLSAVGRNRPGIVAEVSEIVFEAGCNVEDSRMAILGDQFTLMILLSGEGPGVGECLEEGCQRLQEGKEDLDVHLKPSGSGGSGPASRELDYDHEVRVVGLDRAGIVYHTAKLLAAKGIDIGELETRIDPAPESGSPVFTMRAELALPEEVDPKSLRRELDTLADDLRVEISLSRKTKLWS